MVVLLGYTLSAYTTMFTPSRFEEAACTTRLARSEQDMIIRIKTHLLMMIVVGDIGGFRGDAAVRKIIGDSAQAQCTAKLYGAHRPSACRDESQLTGS